MVRPRLVEIGKPCGYDEDDGSDHAMMEAPPPPLQDDGEDDDGDEMNRPPSSLLQALGGNRPDFNKKRPNQKISHRFTIGGDVSSAAISNDDARHRFVGHEHTVSTPPPPPHTYHHHTIGPISHRQRPWMASQADHHHDGGYDMTTKPQYSPGTQQQAGYDMTTTQPRYYSPAGHHVHQVYNHQIAATASHPPPPAAPHRTHFEIGADERPMERMEGVEVHTVKPPLVVLDGANVAYAYALAFSTSSNNNKPEPNSKGILVACRYFQSAGVRVLVVLPETWFRSKPRANDLSRANALMQTDHLDILQSLQQQGLIVSAPPRTDDDAFCLTIAQRENARLQQQQKQQRGSPAFVLSNDLFRDAQERDVSGNLKHWLTVGHSPETGQGRISFAFCDMGALDDHGDRELDIVPNPRHPLVQWIEQHLAATQQSL